MSGIICCSASRPRKNESQGAPATKCTTPSNYEGEATLPRRQATVIPAEKQTNTHEMLQSSTQLTPSATERPVHHSSKRLTEGMMHYRITAVLAGEAAEHNPPPEHEKPPITNKQQRLRSTSPNHSTSILFPHNGVVPNYAAVNDDSKTARPPKGKKKKTIVFSRPLARPPRAENRAPFSSAQHCHVRRL